MTTSIIILIIFVVVLIIDMVIRAKFMSKFKNQSRESFLDTKSQLNKHGKYAGDVLIEFVKEAFGITKANEKFIEQLKVTSNLNRKLIEDFVELSDSEYKRTIKQLMAEKDNAVAMHLQLITAIKSLKDSDRIKIQYRLDNITGLKNGKERKVPATKNKDGGK